MNIIQQLKSLCRTLKQYLINLNIFEDNCIDHESITRQILATRIFLILLVASIGILFVYTSISLRTITETVKEPNLITFQNLEKHYPDTLRCPCRQATILYGQFMKIKPSFHQVCSSDFISQRWIHFTADIDRETLWPMDVRNSLSNIWQMIATLCETGNNFINDALREFNNSLFITDTTVSEAYLELQAQSALENARQTMVDRFRRDVILIQNFLQVNGFVTGLQTNFKAYTFTLSDYSPSSFYFEPSSYELPGGAYCSCTSDQSCSVAAGLYLFQPLDYLRTYNLDYITPNITFPGLKFDCLPSLITFNSSLECFYDQTCVDTLLEYYPKQINVSILNKSMNSRFLPTMVLGEIVDEIFIERIINSTLFDSYYEQCSPISCTYAYHSRFQVSYVLAILVGLIGGLNVILKFVTLRSLSIVMYLKHKFKNRNKQAEISSGKKSCM